MSSTAEAERWSRERGARGRGALETLQATLKEEFPGRYVDSMTGLRNKDYFVNELSKKIAKLKAQGKPLTLLMIDIDHFKWVNDELGHPRGDEVLKSTAQLILDNIREGDIGVRYGGEELLVVIPSDLHTGIILAERLRYAQEQAVAGHEAMSDVHQLASASGEPCGTLSLGVADVTGVTDLSRAVEKSDRALYFAKRSRNTVAFVDPSKDPSISDPFTTYSEYREKAGELPGDGHLRPHRRRMDPDSGQLLHRRPQQDRHPGSRDHFRSTLCVRPARPGLHRRAPSLADPRGRRCRHLVPPARGVASPPAAFPVGISGHCHRFLCNGQDQRPSAAAGDRRHCHRHARSRAVA